MQLENEIFLIVRFFLIEANNFTIFSRCDIASGKNTDAILHINFLKPEAATGGVSKRTPLATASVRQVSDGHSVYESLIRLEN